MAISSGKSGSGAAVTHGCATKCSRVIRASGSMTKTRLRRSWSSEKSINNNDNNDDNYNYNYNKGQWNS
jgi:hypothetical protein